MFRRKPIAIFFAFPREDRYTLHSLFVSFPFHAVFINERKEVVEIRKVEPFTLLVMPMVPFKYLLELPDSPNASVGDVLDF